MPKQKWLRAAVLSSIGIFTALAVSSRDGRSDFVRLTGYGVHLYMFIARTKTSDDKDKDKNKQQ